MIAQRSAKAMSDHYLAAVDAEAEAEAAASIKGPLRATARSEGPAVRRINYHTLVRRCLSKAALL